MPVSVQGAGTLLGPSTLTLNCQESCCNYGIWLRNYRRPNSLEGRTKKNVEEKDHEVKVD